MIGAGIAVVSFLLGVLVGRGTPLLDMIAGGETAEIGDLLADDGLFVAALARRDPSVAAVGDADLSYFERLDEDGGPDLDARMRDAAEASDAGAGIADAVPEGYPTADGAIPASDGYTMQVTTLRERTAAERIAEGLVARGYPAYVVPSPPGAPVSVFRVRVGPYADREEAEQVARRLEVEESFRPWLIR